MKLSDHAPDGAQTGMETEPRGPLQRIVRPLCIRNKCMYFFPVTCICWFGMANLFAQTQKASLPEKDVITFESGAVTHDMRSELSVDSMNVRTDVQSANPAAKMTFELTPPRSNVSAANQAVCDKCGHSASTQETQCGDIVAILWHLFWGGVGGWLVSYTTVRAIWPN